MTRLEYDCNAGGHLWREFDEYDSVDAFGRRTGLRYAMAGPEERFRICPVCKKQQRLIPARWEDCK